MDAIPDKNISFLLEDFGISFGDDGLIEIVSAATDVVVDGGASKSGECCCCDGGVVGIFSSCSSASIVCGVAIGVSY